MANFPSYPTRSFSETQKFFVLDPQTGTPSFVLGSDLVDFLTPGTSFVFSESTRVSAQASNYKVGNLIQTAGAVTEGDGLASGFLVVPGGEGDFAMQNGNDLLVIRGDDLLREQLKEGVVRMPDLAAMESTPGRFDGDAARLVSGTGRDGDFRWDSSDISGTLILSSVASTSVDSGTDTITSAGHGLVDGDGVTVDASVNGLTANALYWVIGATTDTFQLSTSFDGTAVDLTGTTNFTTKQLRDPLQGIYVSSDRTGSSGAWVRQYDGSISVLWFGAVGDWDGSSGTDNRSALSSAFNYKIRDDFNLAYGPGVFIPQPPTQYYCSGEINLKTKNRIFGVGSGIEGENTSSIIFAADSNGIIVNRFNTFSDGVLGTPTKGADGSTIEGITIKSLGGSSGDGLWLRARAVVKDCRILSFAGIGLKIVASSGASAPLEGNANNFSLANMRISNCGSHGVYVNGADVNAGVGIAIDSSANGGDGIFDSSFLGNTWVGCHVNGNATGSYRSDNINARNVWIGCYRETGDPGNSISGSDLVLGGLFGPYSGGVDIRDDSIVMPEGSDFSTSFGSFEAPNSSVHEGVRIRNNAPFGATRIASLAFLAGDENDMAGGVPLASINGRAESSVTSKQRLSFDIYDGSTGSLFTALNLRYVGGASLYPQQDNTLALGKSANRYTEVFAATGTINTSDEREKCEAREITDSERAVASNLKGMIKAYKWRDSVNKKGGNARWHFGVMAQEVKKEFERQGLNGFEYGVLCYDEWEEEVESDGSILPSGNRYGVRYDELMSFIISSL